MVLSAGGGLQFTLNLYPVLLRVYKLEESKV